jgi:hypothetical protein
MIMIINNILIETLKNIIFSLLFIMFLPVILIVYIIWIILTIHKYELKNNNY